MRPSLGALDVELQHMVFCTEFWMGGGLESRCIAPHTRPMQRLSPPIQTLGAENHMLQLNI